MATRFRAKIGNILDRPLHSANRLQRIELDTEIAQQEIAKIKKRIRASKSGNNVAQNKYF